MVLSSVRSSVTAGTAGRKLSSKSKSRREATLAGAFQKFSEEPDPSIAQDPQKAKLHSQLQFCPSAVSIADICMPPLLCMALPCLDHGEASRMHPSPILGRYSGFDFVSPWSIRSPEIRIGTCMQV